MKLYVLNCGHCYVEAGFFLNWGLKEDRGKDYVPRALKLSAPCWFIDHPEAKILIDSPNFRDVYSGWEGWPFRRGPEGYHTKADAHETIPEQLKLIGYSLDDIDYVIESHLGSDHTYLPYFSDKKAKIVVQRAEYEFAKIGPDSYVTTMGWQYVSEQWDVLGLNWKLIDGNYKLVEGVELLHMPGHSPGYQRVLLRLEKTGSVILSACEIRDMYYGISISGAEIPGIPHSAVSGNCEQELLNFRKTLQIAEQEHAQIWCGHDFPQWETLKHVPEYYE